MVSGLIFTTLLFLRKLQTGQISFKPQYKLRSYKCLSNRPKVGHDEDDDGDAVNADDDVDQDEGEFGAAEQVNDWQHQQEN